MGSLTKRVIESLETRPVEYFVWDKELPGFDVRWPPQAAKPS